MYYLHKNQQKKNYEIDHIAMIWKTFDCHYSAGSKSSNIMSAFDCLCFLARESPGSEYNDKSKENRPISYLYKDILLKFCSLIRVDSLRMSNQNSILCLLFPPETQSHGWGWRYYNQQDIIKSMSILELPISNFQGEENSEKRLHRLRIRNPCTGLIEKTLFYTMIVC